MVWTAIPRGIRRYTLVGAALTAKPVNDTYELIVSIGWQSNFAHILKGFWAAITQDVALAYDSGYITITNGLDAVPQGLQIDLPTPYVTSHTVPGATEFAVFRYSDGGNTYPGPLWRGEPANVDPVVTWKVGNRQPAVGAAGTIHMLMEFWEYDLNQAQRFGLNFPIPVQSR